MAGKGNRGFCLDKGLITLTPSEHNFFFFFWGGVVGGIVKNIFFSTFYPSYFLDISLAVSTINCH
jgi:hypothetical protein